MRSGARSAIVGGVFAVMVGGAGYGAYNIVTAVSGENGSAGSKAEQTGPPSGDEVQEATETFFAAWEKGRAATAAAQTNNAEAARSLLTAYSGQAHLTQVKITPGTRSGATVPFAVSATVSYEGRSKPVSYESELTVVRGLTTGKALVDWKPSVVHPDLKTGDTLVTGEAASPPIVAVDRDGAVLTGAENPSLAPILDDLRSTYGDTTGGTPGIELAIRRGADGAGEKTLVTLVKGKAGRLRTTLSASAQAAAEKAVGKYAESSVVAVKPSTGEVLAVANNREDGFNAAFLGKVAPGSTMKIISAATLIDNGVTTANGPAPCPPDATWQSQTFTNLKGMTPNENATLAESFARSCNTAFVKYADEVRVDSLTKEAQERFGLGQDNWKTGIQSFDGSVPASGGPDTAANMLGQGDVQMNPLTMASVTATVVTGTFRQPVIVPQRLDNRELAQAEGLEAGTAAQLRQMMNRTAASGTARAAMNGLGPDYGAKTGSAEVDGQKTSDSWFTGYRGDIAAAAMTEGGGHGSDAAGPIVAAVLRTGG